MCQKLKHAAHAHGPRDTRRAFVSSWIPAALLTRGALAQDQPPADMAERFRRMSEDAERKGLAQPFRGITANGRIERGLFEIHPTGVTTEPVRIAAENFIATLNPVQRSRTLYPVDDAEWRKWMNQHFYTRQGVSFQEMDGRQRDAAFGLLRAGLSAQGLELTRNIMRLNETLAELTSDHDFLGEWMYYITVMGKPSATDPWGWQLDGHHAIINYFVLGDQVVMTPHFMGSEPGRATSGKHQGAEVLQREQGEGVNLIQALPAERREGAILSCSKTGDNNLTEAFKDNVVRDYAGIRGSELSGPMRNRLLDLAQRYVANMDEGHARVKMDEVKRYLESTYFAWIGGTDASSVFY